MIDIGEVDAITTPAITVFITATRAIAAGGGKMAFANVRGNHRRCFHPMPAPT